jgi:hypothetical protein
VHRGNVSADGPTWVIGSNRLCTGKCDGFESITCTRKVVGLGKKKIPPPAPAPTPPPAGQTATVNNDVDVYAEPGGQGQPFGEPLRKGSKVTVLVRQQDQWCQVQGNAVPNGIGWVWGEFLDF